MALELMTKAGLYEERVQQERLENTVFPDSNPARIMALRRCNMLFLAKWPNGDFSLVQAQNRDQAFVVLDDADDPGEAKIVPISEEEGVIINFKATSPRSDSDGLYEFEDLGEDLADALTNRGTKLSQDNDIGPTSPVAGPILIKQ